MNDEQPTSSEPSQSRGSRIGSFIAWAILVIAGFMCSMWIIAPKVYLLDVLASHQMLWGWCTLGYVLLVMVVRRLKAWRFAVVGLFFISIAMYPVCTKRIFTLPDVQIDQKPDTVIRVITSNIHPVNTHWKEDLKSMFAMGADVVVLNEVSPELSRAIRFDGYLESTAYPNWVHRFWVENETSPGIIISRWPIQHIAPSDTIKLTQNHLYATIQLPAGEVIMGLAHPLSPRNNNRWREGNLAIESQGLRIKELIAQTGNATPIIIGADLNAGPAQTRASTMRDAGMSMSKPVLRVGGSFPANTWVPTLLQIQLDDVWTHGKIKPVAWSAFDLIGSDHRGVVVDLEFE